MIGNDIVDLKIAKKESNWQRPRYLQKVFTDQEQQYIDAASNKELMIWLLWSRKESAYKIVNRLTGKRFFAPKKLVNATLNYSEAKATLSGQVNFDGYSFFTESKFTSAYIHSVASKGSTGQCIQSNCFYLPKSDYTTQQTYTREKLIENYAAHSGRSTAELSVQKDVGKIPYLIYKNERQSSHVSISHHGHYGAFIFQSPNTHH